MPLTSYWRSRKPDRRLALTGRRRNCSLGFTTAARFVQLAHSDSLRAKLGVNAQNKCRCNHDISSNGPRQFESINSRDYVPRD